MAMSRKDYEIIAKAIKTDITDNYGDSIAIEVLERFAVNIAVKLKKENSRFDGEIFRKACGY